MTKTLDGWDAGILIRVCSHNKTFENSRENYQGITFEHICSELISEVGWLKRGDEELEERLKNLVDLGYLSMVTCCCACVNPTRFWRITQKALERFEGLK